MSVFDNAERGDTILSEEKMLSCRGVIAKLQSLLNQQQMSRMMPVYTSKQRVQQATVM